jgi:hypothetical protein
MNLKRGGINRPWSNFKVLSQHLRGGTEQNREKKLNQDSLSLGRYLNPGPPEYGAGMLTTRQQRSVCKVITLNFVYSLKL